MTDQSNQQVIEICFNQDGGAELVKNGLEMAEIQENLADSNQEMILMTSKYFVQCANCDNIFSQTDFQSHVCDFGEDKKLISEESDKITVAEPLSFLTNHPCFAQLEENCIKIRRFIKEELKITLKNTLPYPMSKSQDPTYQAGPSSSLSSSKDAHECHHCLRKFVHKSGLLRHMSKHQLENKNTLLTPSTKTLHYDLCILCLLCGRVFSSVDNCEAHLNSEEHQAINPPVDSKIDNNNDEQSESKAVVVIDLQEIRQTRGVVERELVLMRPVVLRMVYQCEFCDYVFMRKEDLLKHEATHDPQLGYICTLCEMNLLSIKEIQQHWQVHCPYMKDFAGVRVRLQTEYVCNVCFDGFPSMDILYDHRHKENHYYPRYSQFTEELLIGCEICGNMYDNFVKYCIHYNDNHTNKRVKKATLSRNRQYLCDVCGKMYTQSSHLWQHLRFHQGVKPFECPVEGCSRRFTIRPDLNDHVRKCHTYERPYQCLVCGKRFLTGSVFYQHRLIHRGERRYGCEVCNKRFYRADALKNHSRIHTGEKPYKCTMCTKQFRQRGDRDKHLKARHKIQQ